MSNGGQLVAIPSDQGVNKTVLNTNVRVGDITLHVQTEEIKPSKLIVTCVLHEGQVIDRVERSYAGYEGKPNIRELIQKVASAQHTKKVVDVPLVWGRISRATRIQNKSTLRPIPMPVTPQLDETRALELFELGLTLYKEDPLRTREVWEEAVRLDPENKRYRVNLKRLKDLSQGVLPNDTKSGCFSACFKSIPIDSAKLRLVKTG
jgi:hypothetical protein